MPELERGVTDGKPPPVGVVHCWLCHLESGALAKPHAGEEPSFGIDMPDLLRRFHRNRYGCVVGA